MVLYKIVVTVPVTHADQVREAIGLAGAGRVGAYAFCSFSSRGTGRFKPEAGAHPTIGVVGTLEEVEEERIEVTCPKNLVTQTIEAIKRVHPYEQIVLDVYELSSWSIG